MLEKILSDLTTTNTQLVAVSKTKPVDHILEIYHKGQRVFGENKAQELKEKHSQLPQDIEWHFIGHLQTNKVKLIAPFVKLIHSIDSWRLLKAVNKEASKQNRVIDCLLQFHIATENTKFGLDITEAEAFLTSPEFQSLEYVRIVGVMGMATFTNNTIQVRSEFKNLKGIFDQLKGNVFPDSIDFKEVSMGMSGDYAIAIEEGSTIVRIGSLIFGRR